MADEAKRRRVLSLGVVSPQLTLLLGHADARMADRVYGRLDRAQMGGELRAVFGALRLAAPEPTAGTRTNGTGSSGGGAAVISTALTEPAGRVTPGTRNVPSVTAAVAALMAGPPCSAPATSAAGAPRRLTQVVGALA